MKRCVAAVLLLTCLTVFAQSPDAIKHAPRLIFLFGDKDTEPVLPMVFTENGQQRLEFVPASKVSAATDKGAIGLRFGDVLAALGDATQQIGKLQQENEKLWKVVMKDAPPQQPTTVIVQQPPPLPANNALAQYLLLRSLIPQSSTVNMNVQFRDCTRFPALCVH